MKQIKQFSIWVIAVMGWMIAGAATVQAQGVNMDRYITLTVQSGQNIKLKFLAAADDTPVLVKSGANSTDVTVGTDWSADQEFMSDGTTMTVYGDLDGFDCLGNGAKLTVLDASHNAELKTLLCMANQLTAVDVSACTQLKELWCFENRLPALDLSACTRLEKLRCSENHLTVLDVSACTQLKRLECSDNDLSTLNVSACTQLKELSCFDNDLSTLDVSACTRLEKLVCYGNDLSTLNVSACTRLEELDCGGNDLTAVDVSACTQLKVLWCFENRLTALDVSACAQLEKLYCEKNNFSTAALNRLYCSLPDRTSTTEGVIYSADNNTDPGHANVLASSGSIATGKNWKVQYSSDDSDIPTTGMETCASANMDRYITLTVQSGQNIKLKFLAAADDTPVKVVSGANSTDVTVGTDWSADQEFMSDGTTMTVYGDIDGFECRGNGAKVTALDASHNAELETLYCIGNQLTALDASHNAELKTLFCMANQLTVLDLSACTQLDWLNCSENRLPALDVNACTQLKWLYCRDNDLPALDVSACIRLEKLICDNNRLSALDLSHNAELKELYCHENRLSALDVSACTQLKALYCEKNNFSTGALNRLYCSLPDRTSTTEGKIWLATDNTDPGHANVLASSGSIATGKNWKVQYSSDDSDIPTTGTKTCGPAFAVTPETVDITFAGETKPLTVNASEAWTARCDAPWLTLSALSGTGDGTITVTAPAYADEWPRTAKIFFVSGALKETVTVTQHPKPGPKFVALDYTELTLPVGASQRLVVTAYPKDADINRGVKWYSLNDDIATVSANGTVTALKPGRTEITVVANVGGQQTTCRVRVVPAEQMVSVTPAGENKLLLSLVAFTTADFTLSFDVDLPEGFALDAKKTAPDASLADGYTVTVTGNRVEMKPGGLRAGGTIEKRDLLTLACTAVPGTSNGSYKGALRNLTFTPTTGYALRNVTVPFTFTYTVANETVDGLRVYAAGSALRLMLPKAETVHIYHVSGAMVKTLALPAGDHVQPLPPGVYLVRVGERVTKILIK